MFPGYGVHPGASSTVCCAAPPLDECGFAARRCAPDPRMNTYARPAEGAEDQKPGPDQEPLTLALSRRERELIEVIGRDAPMWIPSRTPMLKSPKIDPLSLGRGLGGRRSDEGRTQPKINADRIALPPLNTMSVSSSAALDLRARRQAEWRDSSGEDIERRCSEANRNRCPGWIPERRNPEPQRVGRTSGQSLLGYLFGVWKR